MVGEDNGLIVKAYNIFEEDFIREEPVVRSEKRQLDASFLGGVGGVEQTRGSVMADAQSSRAP